MFVPSHKRNLLTAAARATTAALRCGTGPAGLKAAWRAAADGLSATRADERPATAGAAVRCIVACILLPECPPRASLCLLPFGAGQELLLPVWHSFLKPASSISSTSLSALARQWQHTLRNDMQTLSLVFSKQESKQQSN
jgi:hypothetical protein